MKEISSKDAVFTVHIEGREAVELEGVEIAGFTESHPDKILVDRAFMQMAHKVKDLLQQRAELLEALKKIAAIPNKDFGSDWEEIEEARTISMMAIQKAYE